MTSKEYKSLYKDLKEANKWCKVFGLPPITFYEFKKQIDIIQNSWAFEYTTNGVKYYSK